MHSFQDPNAVKPTTTLYRRGHVSLVQICRYAVGLCALGLAVAKPALGQNATKASRTNLVNGAATAVPEAALPYTPGKRPRSWAIATAESVMARWPDYTKAYFNTWTYVNGYTLCAFERLYKDTGEARYFEYIKRYVDQIIDQNGEFRSLPNARGQVRPIRFTNLDNMMTGHILVMLYEYTGDLRYRRAAEKIRAALNGYPRNRDGGFWHATGLHGQMWIDGIFMGQMFLIRYGKAIADADYAWEEATRQITVFARRAEKNRSGLFLHAVYEPGHGPRPCPWANPSTGLSPEVWSEGLGWYALVVVETLAVLPTDHPGRADVIDIFRRLAGALKKHQDPRSGCWFQVVDKGGMAGNWTDTSGSAMFVYALARGIELGLIPRKEYLPVVRKGYKGITSFARVNERGLVDIYNACDGLGVQTNYLAYVSARRAVNAKEAVAGFLWATEIVERPAIIKAAQTQRGNSGFQAEASPTSWHQAR